MSGVARLAIMRKGMPSLAAGVLATVLMSGCSTTPPSDTFDLAAPVVSTDRSAQRRQILVPVPSAIKAINSEKIMVRVSPSEVQYLSGSQWSDTLPRMVQAKLVQAFEATGKLAGVGVPGQGLAIDEQVVTEIRAFEVQAYGGVKQANIAISVKILNDRNGSVKATKLFTATAPVSGSEPPAFVDGLDRAFADIANQIVSWSLGVI
jgi:cholesterol transport system auxiliary component